MSSVAHDRVVKESPNQCPQWPHDRHGQHVTKLSVFHRCTLFLFRESRRTVVGSTRIAPPPSKHFCEWARSARCVLESPNRILLLNSTWSSLSAESRIGQTSRIGQIYVSFLRPAEVSQVWNQMVVVGILAILIYVVGTFALFTVSFASFAQHALTQPPSWTVTGFAQTAWTRSRHVMHQG